MRTQLFALCLVLLMVAGIGSRPPAVWAQAAGKPATGHEKPAAGEAPEGHAFMNIVLAGGIVGHTIILSSVVAMALAVDQAWKIRTSALMPPGLADKVRASLQAGQLAPAQQQCKLQPSVLATVLYAGLSEIDAGWPGAEKAMEDMVAEQSARLFRRIEYLSVIGNIAPMLGLLGTVIGMVVAFRQVAITQGAARAADLAEGIYLALVTTVEGLIVAIPCLGVFAILRNRIDELIAEVAYTAQHAMLPVRQARPAAPRRQAPMPPPVEGRA